jgi:hypothetical protein
MTSVLLFGGILLVLMGLAALGSSPAASAKRRSEHARGYGLVTAGLGAALLIAAVVMIVS